MIDVQGYIISNTPMDRGAFSKRFPDRTRFLSWLQETLARGNQVVIADIKEI